MELLGVLTQHFLSPSNFTQHKKLQCWVTQHGGQTIQHFIHDMGLGEMLGEILDHLTGALSSIEKFPFSDHLKG